MTQYLWQENILPPIDMPISQVYAFARNNAGEFLLYTDQGNYNLPGGKPATNDHGELDTLARECLEECQFTFHNPQYLGYVLVQENETAFAQLRYLVMIDTFYTRKIDPATGRKYQRHLVDLHVLARLLGWGPHLYDQIATLQKVLGAI